jgi:flagellar hook-associated protein 2
MSNSISTASSVDISSILQALTGSTTSGLNVADLVSTSAYAARAPERGWQASQSTLQTENSLLTQVSSLATSLYDDMSALADPIGVMVSLSASSSDTGIVGATVASGAIAGTHTIHVTNLAQTGSWYSESVASSTTALSSGTFEINASGGSFTVTVGSGVNTLDDVASYINSQDKGVTASVIKDSQGARLAIVSTGSGAAKDFSISNVSLTNGSPFMDFTQAVQGKDASLTVDGVPISSATNTVSGALTGVTLNLKGYSTTTDATLTIAPNTSSMASAISSFVSDYNTLITGINGQFKYDSSTGTSGALSGDSTVRNLQSDMLNAMTYTASSGAITSLRSLGITMQNDGTLTVDSATLNNALTNNKDAVLHFFQGDSSNGFANTFEDRLQLYTNTADGAFTVELKNNKEQIGDLQEHIDDLETYVTAQQKIWTEQYSEAASALLSLPTKLKQIETMLGNDSND